MNPAKAPAVARYARNLDAAWRAWESLPEGTVAGRTDRGGDRVHPALEAAIKAEQAAVAFGVALGLEPDARRAPGGQLESRMQPTAART